MKFFFCFLFVTTLSAIDLEVPPLLEPSYDQERVILLNPQEFSSENLEFDNPLLEQKKNVPWAVTLASVFPGLGHVYLGDVKTASWQTGSGLLTGGLAVVTNPKVAVPSYYTLANLSCYSIYSAYRDARIYNRNDGYQYSMPNDSFISLLTAPFSWTVLKKPQVWGGIVASLGIATIAQYAFYPHASASLSDAQLPLVAFPVAIGEEAYFRGFLQPVLSEYTSPKTAIYLQAIAFGAAHIPNAMLLDRDERSSYYFFSLPLITAFGAYAGWLTERTHSLREAVAIHAWYDFTIFSLELLAPKAKATRSQCYGFSIPF